mmetsp:Transcript_77467/g.230766  ORF Transcript_77467/g.230766 Transcript_77467/m.230766 type:complete len:263 (+) Transcript_77467:294-1082(+)
MGEQLRRRAALLGAQPEHGEEEGGEVLGFQGVHVVLLLQDILEAPEAQRLDMTELTPAVEVGHRASPTRPQGLRHGAQQLDEKRQVVLVPGVLLRGLGVEEVVASDQLEKHAGQGPDVRRGVVACVDDGLWRPVLPRLNVVGEVPLHPTGIAQVGHLERHTCVGEEVETTDLLKEFGVDVLVRRRRYLRCRLLRRLLPRRWLPRLPALRGRPRQALDGLPRHWLLLPRCCCRLGRCRLGGGRRLDLHVMVRHPLQDGVVAVG